MSKMKNYITINQKNLIEIAKLKKIKVDAVDGLLFDWIQNFTNSEKVLKKLINNKLYIWVSYKSIREQNPLAHINNNEVVARRLDKLVQLGLLKKYLSKKDGNKTFFAITEFAFTYLLEGRELSTQESGALYSKVDTLSTFESYNSKLRDSELNYKKNIKEKKSFSFTLCKKMEIENTSVEYKDKLKEYIENNNKPISYTYFYNACVAKGYQYKNFKAAYDRWAANTNKLRCNKTIKKSLQQKNKEFVDYLFSKKVHKDVIDVDIVQGGAI